MRDHAAITDDDHLLEPELITQLTNFRQKCLCVAGVAFVNRDGDGTAAPIGQQTIVDLQLAILAVAIFAKRRQWVGLALEVTRAQVVEYQPAGFEMTVREFALDRALALEQPIHRRIEVIFIGRGDAEIVGERAGFPPARHCQLGVWRHDPGGHHAYHKIGFAARA